MYDIMIVKRRAVPSIPELLRVEPDVTTIRIVDDDAWEDVEAITCDRDTILVNGDRVLGGDLVG